jgi:hypothetical protein
MSDRSGTAPAAGPAAGPAGAEGTGAPPHPSRTAVAVVAAAALGAVLALVIAVLAARDPNGADDLEITIPRGAAVEHDAVDAVLSVDLGGDLVVRNDDARLHVLGPVTVEPGETVRHSFPGEGRYRGTTSLRRDGLVTILVQDG